MRDNNLLDNGTSPDLDNEFGILLTALGYGADNPVPDTVWDGFKAEPDEDANICLGTDPDATGTWLNWTQDQCQDEIGAALLPCIIANNSDSTADHLCE